MEIVIKQVNTYDHIDRLTTVTHQTASQEVVTIAQNDYNEVGQLKDKKIHQSASHPSSLQKLDYFYNIRGWPNNINKPASYESNGNWNSSLGGIEVSGNQEAEKQYTIGIGEFIQNFFFTLFDQYTKPQDHITDN
ncbi:MAG TPA: hypothetical protein VK543_15575 [Puia sp.]|nr:hypothetical protein [Puia sp.]